MNNPHLDQAREWARDNIDDFYEGQRVYAACEVIQSLPDEWIDAEKVRELIDTYKHARDGNAAGTEGWVMNHLVVRNLESLITPPLPTLDELTRGLDKDIEQYRWMQAEVFHTGERGAITDFNLYAETATVLFPNGVMKNVPWEDITPLPDLPRLEWPAQAPRIPETPPAETLNNASSDTPRNPRPEDVPVGEAWLVKTRDGEKREALKTSTGWMVKDGDDVELWVEEALEPVARLVPEDKP